MRGQTSTVQPERATAYGRPRPEVVVIGAGLGGLSAAIHLRLAGYRVRVFEANERVGGRANIIVQDGFQFDTGPSLLNYPWVFEDLFRAAGRELSDYVRLLPVDPSISFRWPDGVELTLSSDIEKLTAGFEHIEPGSAARLRRFLADASEKYRITFTKLACRNEDSAARWFAALSVREALKTGVWRSLYGEIGRFFRSRYIREALGSYGMYLGGSPFKLPGLFSILPYGEIAYGLWLPRGGIYGLVCVIERIARELGVVIETGARVSWIGSHGGQVSGICFADKSRQSASVLVSNVDAPTTQTELLGRKPPKVRMTPGVLTFYWGVRGKPANLGHHTIFLPRDYRGAFEGLFHGGVIPEDLPFYVAVPSATDPQLAPAGRSSMFVLVPTPVLSRLGSVDWSETVERVKSQVLDRLQQSGVHLETDSIVAERFLTPLDWQRQVGLYDGSAFGAAHSLSQTGPFRFRNYSSEVEGLYFVGSSTTPGTGMPMVVLGGRMTAERIRTRVS
jgi:phytoene desaturase